MARTAKGPWFRKSTGWWMTTVGGRQHKLAEGRHNRHLAVQKFHELMLVVSQSPDAVEITVLTVCELFLDWAQRHRSAETVRGLTFYLQSFAEDCGYLVVADLKPYQVQAWVDGHTTWKQTTHFNAIGAVLRAFNWGAQQQIIARNPIAGMKRPRPRSRRLILERSTYLRLRRAARPEFKYLLASLWETGARPSELRQLKWSQVKQDRLVLNSCSRRSSTGSLRWSSKLGWCI
jgi:integrase